MYVVSSISGILMCEVYDTFWFTYGFHAFFRSYCENMDEESHLSIDEIDNVYLFLSLFWYHVYLSLFSQLKAKFVSYQLAYGKAALSSPKLTGLEISIFGPVCISTESVFLQLSGRKTLIKVMKMSHHIIQHGKREGKNRQKEIYS